MHTLATGQHTTRGSPTTFFADLALEPDTRWELPADESRARRRDPARAAYDDARAAATPTRCCCSATRYTVPLFALAARRFGVPVVHLEAGLRSFNPQSVEEGNRRVVARARRRSTSRRPSSRRACSTPKASRRERIVVVGNPVTDSLRRHGPPRRARSPNGRVRWSRCTAPTNVDDPERLRALVGARCAASARELGPVRFPVHPRTRDRLERAGCSTISRRRRASRLEAPLRYGEMLEAVARRGSSSPIRAASRRRPRGTACPSVVLRATTPRWEGVLAGTSALVGVDADRALDGGPHTFCAPDEQRRVAAVTVPVRRRARGRADRVGARRPGDATVCSTVAEPGLGERASPSLLEVAPMIGAVLFDLDDTLYPAGRLARGRVGRGRTARGASRRARATSSTPRCATIAADGTDRGRIIDRALGAVRFGRRCRSRRSSTRSERTRRRRSNCIPAFVDELRAALGARAVGIVTDGDPRDPAGEGRARSALDVDVVVFSDELGREHRKPDPLPFLRALDRARM